MIQRLDVVGFEQWDDGFHVQPWAPKRLPVKYLASFKATSHFDIPKDYAIRADFQGLKFKLRNYRKLHGKLRQDVRFGTLFSFEQQSTKSPLHRSIRVDYNF